MDTAGCVTVTGGARLRPVGTVADISYFEVNSDPQNSSAVVGDVVAQGDIDSIGCRIVVDGQVKAERIRTK